MPYLRRESNVTDGAKEGWRKPVDRTNKELPFKMLAEDVNFLVASSKLSDIGKKGHTKDIGSKDIVENTSTKILQTLDSVRSFLYSIVELSMGRAGTKLESKIFPVSLNGKFKPSRDKLLKTGSEILGMVRRCTAN